jgi:hypothetical protein
MPHTLAWLQAAEAEALAAMTDGERAEKERREREARELAAILQASGMLAAPERMSMMFSLLHGHP